MLTPLPLPEPSQDERAHSARVAAHLQEAIAQGGGWVPFSRFMQEALYAPGLGYYSAGARKFGAEGDFVTAPELTPVFARCLATQVAQVLAETGGSVVEAGAGSGALAVELLSTLAARDALPERYEILEVSADLRERQRAALADCDAVVLERVRWIDAPPAGAWQGVVIANEVLDALPVERFGVTTEGFETLGVTEDGGEFRFEPRPAPPDLVAAIEARTADLKEPLPAGYESELCTWVRPWIAELGRGMTRGALLLADYGLPRPQYYHPSRAGGSLCAFFRHRRVEDVLARPGLQDITAWVDFTEVAEAGLDAGLELAGFATQAHFLLSLGLERELAAASEGLDTAGRARLSQAAAMLVLPGEMGERFKVMALSRGLKSRLSGFSFRDLAATL